VVKIARGAFLTGCAASLVMLVFALSHAADRDPWQWPASFMCMGTWFISYMLATWYYGYRRGDHQEERLFRDLPPPQPEPRYRVRITVAGMMGVSLASALFLAFNAPFIWFAYHGASFQAKTRSLRKLSREELHKRVLGTDEEDTFLALRELRLRRFNDDDRAAFAGAFGDVSLPARARHLAGVGLTGCPPPHPEEVISLVAMELDSDNPDVRLSAAWVLGKIAPDAPTRFDIAWGHGRRVMTPEKYRAYVPLFQRWWKTRRQREGTARPGMGATPLCSRSGWITKPASTGAVLLTVRTILWIELVDLDPTLGELRDDLELAAQSIHNPAQSRDLHVGLFF
jgi:hypothetical protein